MYTVRVRSQFSGAHNLRNYKGKCESLHGHNWYVEVTASSAKLDKAGMVMDFHKLKSLLNGVITDLDHKYLNNEGYFKTKNPTSEEIARYIYKRISQKRSGPGIKEVTVWETDTSSATYSE